uniref:hypothetical protein n=1 Tax=Candidatus Electrothrix sp. TaxID=2170559 RepID=UPI004055E2ED
MTYKEEFLRDALESYKEEYSDLSEIWRNLDGKAQGLIAVSGTFVAGMFAFIRTLLHSVTYLEKCFLTASLVLLVFSIFLALVVQKLRTVAKPPQGESLYSIINDLINIDEDSIDQYRIDYFKDHIRLWQKANKDVHDVNENKASTLLWAQSMLVFSIVCFVIYTLITIWST